MSLIDGYGVLVGTLHSYECDSGRSDTEYYHCNILVRAASAIFRCAVDLDSKKQKDGLQWRVLRISRSDLEAVVDLSPGWHMLVSERGEGLSIIFAVRFCALRKSVFMFVREPGPVWLTRLRDVSHGSMDRLLRRSGTWSLC